MEIRNTTMRRTAGLSALAIAAGLLAACGTGGPSAPQSLSLGPDPAVACARLAAPVPPGAIGLPSGMATIDTATLVAAAPLAVAERGPSPAARITPATPAHCRLLGRIAPLDAAAPPIGFQVNLPLAWNGRSLQYGGGGFNGVLITGLALVPAARFDQPTPLAQGYVTYGTDSGHQNVAGQPPQAFALNDEALENYFGDQLRKTRDVAVKLIARRYGAAPVRTYAAGGSGGGREALYVADRWPALYDGVIAYFPAWSLTGMLTNYAITSKALAAPGAWSNPAKQQLLTRSVVAACDALDGATDGVIAKVSACAFDPATLACPGAADSGDGCLSTAQIGGFRAYATPLKLPYLLANGTDGYAALNIFDGGVIPAMGSSAPATPSRFDMAFATYIGESFVKYMVYRDASYDPFLFAVDANGYVQQRLRYISSRLDVNPDLSAFANKGGKVLIVHGMADPLIPAGSSEEFHRRAVAAMGSARVDAFLKYYEVPGYGHGGGAYDVRFDSVDALERWVEQGLAPSNPTVADANAGNNGRTRPLCEYPAWPRYNGTGDVDLASSFTCVR